MAEPVGQRGRTMPAHPSLYAPAAPFGSRFDHIDDIAGRVEADGDQRPAEAAAGIDADGELADGDAAMLRVEAADHPAEAVDRPVDPGKGGGRPPQAVALRRQGPRRIDAGMDEQQRPV